jgi:uncharacterized protein (DUF58 family)
VTTSPTPTPAGSAGSADSDLHGLGHGRFLDPRLLAACKGLCLRPSARAAAEGSATGTHRSPRHGSSADFADHRAYSLGDELRRVDWKVYARSDRLQIKQSETETDRPVWLAVDASGSMAYGPPRHPSKFEVAARIAATLAVVAGRAHDAVGLTAYGRAGGAETWVSPARGNAHLARLVAELESAESRAGGPGADVAALLTAMAGRLPRRGMVVLIGDLLGPEAPDAAPVLAALRLLRRRGHEVAVLRVMDPRERSFPFDDVTIFEGLEGEGDIPVDAAALRAGYLEALARHTAVLRGGCREERIDFVDVDTSEPLDRLLPAWLASRGNGHH